MAFVQQLEKTLVQTDAVCRCHAAVNGASQAALAVNRLRQCPDRDAEGRSRRFGWDVGRIIGYDVSRF
ncbi:MAG TPA: hypothetical protein DD640_08760 [Clostridiales bacterium]|nr:hypothetical protein [Clostridiales bacterium]